MSVEHAGTGHRCSLFLQSDYFSSGYQRSTILPIHKLEFLPKYEIGYDIYYLYLLFLSYYVQEEYRKKPSIILFLSELEFRRRAGVKSDKKINLQIG